MSAEERNEDLVYIDPFIAERRKLKARKSRKFRQKAKEKLVLSGYGHSLVKRLAKEESNKLEFEWRAPKYWDYKINQRYVFLSNYIEDELENI